MQFFFLYLKIHLTFFKVTRMNCGNIEFRVEAKDPYIAVGFYSLYPHDSISRR